jgi:hypothetical protein
VQKEGSGTIYREGMEGEEIEPSVAATHKGNFATKTVESKEEKTVVKLNWTNEKRQDGRRNGAYRRVDTQRPEKVQEENNKKG